jgi:hypothetical protein
MSSRLADPVKRNRPGAQLPIDLVLDGQEEIRCSLHFIEGQPRRSPEELLRRALGLSAKVDVIERDVEPIVVG